MKNAQTAVWITILIIALIIIITSIVYFQMIKPSKISPEKITEESKDLVNNMPIISDNPDEKPVSKTEVYSSKTYNIDIIDFAFSPTTITIKKGDKVTWINRDSVKHTVTSDSGNELDSKLFGENEDYSHIFNNVGTFDYHCKPHPYMKARIIVENFA